MEMEGNLHANDRDNACELRRVHRLRCIDYVPSQIRCLAATVKYHGQPYLAVGRANGDIEIYVDVGIIGREKYNRWELYNVGYWSLILNSQSS